MTQTREHTGKWVTIARILRPQGRRGELLAEILTDFPERFTALREAFLQRNDKTDPQSVILEQSWPHKGRIVLKFAGVDSISDAELLRGANLVIPLEARAAVDDDTTYIADLIGCQLIDTAQPGSPVIGEIVEVVSQQETADLLVVKAPDGNEHLIPFARAYLVRIDALGRRLEMALPSGLLDINAPMTEEERRVQDEESPEQ